MVSVGLARLSWSSLAMISSASNLDSSVNRGHKQTDANIMVRKGLRQGTKQEAVIQIKLLWDKMIDLQVEVSSWLSGVWTYSACCVRMPVVRTSPSLSGVPQGSVLGSTLFLIFINDLPDNLGFSVRLFADDCVLYRNASSLKDCEILQEDRDKLKQWEADWKMKFM